MKTKFFSFRTLFIYLFFFAVFLFLNYLVTSTNRPIDNDITEVENILSVRYSSQSLVIDYVTIMFFSYLISFGILSSSPIKSKRKIQLVELELLPFHLAVALFFFIQPFILIFLSPYFGVYSLLYPYSAQIAEVLSILSLVVILSFSVFAFQLLNRGMKEKTILKYFLWKQAAALFLVTLLFLIGYFIHFS